MNQEYSNSTKFKFVKQLDSMQCGVAALSMICYYYGKHITLKTLSAMCPPTKEGVSLLGIKSTAENIGFETIYGRFSINTLKQTIPCILHWNQNHFVVLKNISNNGQLFQMKQSGTSESHILYAIRKHD